MKFTQEQQKKYAKKLMVGRSFNEWDVASFYHLQAENNLKEAQRTFEIAHQQALLSTSDDVIINDPLLFRGLVWMSAFSEYARGRLYEISRCLAPHVTVSCTDEQKGWENYPVLYFTMKQKDLDDATIDHVRQWFSSFAQGRQFISCPVVYTLKRRFGQLRYVHNLHTGEGQVISNEQVLLSKDLTYCLRYITDNWWYHPATTRDDDSG